MRIGSMDIKIEVQQQSSSTKTAANEKILTWSTLVTLWGRRRFKPLGETERMGQLTSTQEVMFQTRYISGILPKMRLLSEGEYYQITKVEPVGRNQEMVITAIQKDSWN